MKKKILFTASVPLHFRAFHLPYLKWFQQQGYETHVACNGYEELPYVDKLWEVPFKRAPFSLGNIAAYKELKKIIDSENYVLAHCHTPMASVLTRLASGTARKNGMKLLYTAHGFHFYKGASVINWLLFYPIETLLSKYTDAIICINLEDFDLIRFKGNKNCEYFLIPGIGVNNTRFFKASETEKSEIRKKNNYQNNDFLLIYAAEYINRKNHRFIINAVKENQDKLDGIKVLFAGKGILEEKLKSLVKQYDLHNHIHFLGFRKDIHEIYKMADVGISSSKQEGLAINLVEVMMSGLPAITSNVRGHKEVVDHAINGYLFDPKNIADFISQILTLKSNPNLYQKMAENALKKSAKFDLENSLKEMVKIYKAYL